MTGLVEPVDPIHADSVRAIARIREWFAATSAVVARWEPRPYPGRRPR